MKAAARLLPIDLTNTKPNFIARIAHRALIRIGLADQRCAPAVDGIIVGSMHQDHGNMPESERALKLLSRLVCRLCRGVFHAHGERYVPRSCRGLCWRLINCKGPVAILLF